MEFIAISDDVLVNPDKISVIEKRKGRIVIHIEGQQYIVEKNMAEVVKQLIKNGMKESVEQFFAG